MIFSYTFRKLRRTMGQALTLVLLGCLLIILLLKLNSILAQQLSNKQEMLPKIPIHCAVTDQRGEKTEGLSIPFHVMEYITMKAGPLFPFADKVCARCVIGLDIPVLSDDPRAFKRLKMNERSLVALTRLEAERKLDSIHGARIEFFPGYDEGRFQDTAEYYCLLPLELFQEIFGETEPMEGLFPMNIAVNLLGKGSFGKTSFAHEIKVVGHYIGGGADVYCNWKIAIDWHEEVGGEWGADSLSFTLRDNDRLDEFRSVAEIYFKERSIPTSYNTRYSLTVHDHHYNATLFSTERNIKMLGIVIPLLNILAVGIGFVVSFIFIRNRKHEFALMSSLGTSRLKIFSSVLFELALLMFTGTAAGVVFNSKVILGTKKNIFIPTVFFFCFMSGAVAAIAKVTSTDVITMLSRE